MHRGSGPRLCMALVFDLRQTGFAGVPLLLHLVNDRRERNEIRKGVGVVAEYFSCPENLSVGVMETAQDVGIEPDSQRIAAAHEVTLRRA